MVFKLLGTGRDDGVLQFDGHECTNETMVDSNEMFVNEAIHQGTDMRHPMCPNAIFSREKKPRPKSSGARIFAEYRGLSCDLSAKKSSSILMLATNGDE